MLNQLPAPLLKLLNVLESRISLNIIVILIAAAVAWVLLPVATANNLVLYAMIALLGVVALVSRFGWLALVVLLIGLPEVSVPTISFDLPIAMPVALLVFGIKVIYRGRWNAGGIGVLFILFILAQLLSWLAAQSTFLTGLEQLDTITTTSTRLGQNRVLTQVGAWVLGFGVFLFAANQIRNGRDMVLLTRLIIIVGLAVALYGIYEYVAAQFGLPYFYPSVDKFGQTPTAAIGYKGVLYPRIYSSFEEPKLLGRFLLVPLFLGLSTWTVTRSNRLLLVCAVIFGAVVMTFSTTAWLGLVVGFGVWVYLSEFYKRPDLIKAALPMVLLLLAAWLIIAALVLGGTSSGLKIVNLHASRIVGIGVNRADVSSDYLDGWSLGYRLFRASPITGVGIGNSPYYSGITEYVFTPFSLYLILLAETGAIGFAIFMLFIATPVRRAWKAIRMTRASPEVLMEPAILIGAIAAFMAGIPTYAAFGGARFYLEDWILIALMVRGATLVVRAALNNRAH